MAVPADGKLTYDDLQRFPDDNLRRELIDGELIVTPAPATRHQDVVLKLGARLLAYTEQHGGRVFVAPTDVYLSDVDVVEPDVLFVRAEHAARVEKRFVRSAPDVVVEVSSPSTRRLELVRKRALYERYGVADYWYVDLDADRVEVHRLQAGRYGPPRLLGRGDTLDSLQVPGFAIAVDDLLRAPEEQGGQASG
ncbi:MAG TPA: Uma2 family endonuclease [Egibacteraceae bacterium]|nr:Uma2 family endonuclease [Actinomycetota bacterium]HWB71865.1 Uma2 family endonuclease [Egibacteraceae bacterium]